MERLGARRNVDRVQTTRKQYKDLQVAQSVGIIGERNEATIGQGHNERREMG